MPDDVNIDPYADSSSTPATQAADAAPSETTEPTETETTETTVPDGGQVGARQEIDADQAVDVPAETTDPVDPTAAAAASITVEVEGSVPTAGLTDAPSRTLASPTAHGLSYAVDIVFCIDVTGSMTPVLDAVKTNALRFYDDVQTNLTDKGKHVDQLRVRVVAFRDFNVSSASPLVESAFFPLPDEQVAFDQFVSELVAEGGGDAPESGLEAVALAINSPWTTRGDRRRQVVVVWTDQPAHALDRSVIPPDLTGSIPADFSALTDLWEDTQGLLGPSSKRLILFAPDGAGWSDISANWENVVHHPSQAGGGLSEVDYSTIIDSIGNSV